MKLNTLVSLLIALVVGTGKMNAQTGKGYNVGETVSDFRLKNVDDRQISLADYRNQKGIIVVFTCNHCPFSKAYEDRILALDRLHAPQGYPVLAIMPNDPAAYEDDSFENMKVRAREKAYTFPYTIDETQAVSRAFGATRTPQVYVLKRVGAADASAHFVVAYAGTIDDNPQDAGGIQKRYVDEAIISLLAGKPVAQTTTKAIGCAIKWKTN